MLKVLLLYLIIPGRINFLQLGRDAKQFTGLTDCKSRDLNKERDRNL